MANNHIAKALRRAYDNGMENGVQSGGLYWTCVENIALFNIFDFTPEQFDALEAEMQRIHKEEMQQGDIEENAARLLSYVNRIRGGEYIEELKPEEKKI